MALFDINAIKQKATAAVGAVADKYNTLEQSGDLSLGGGTFIMKQYVNSLGDVLNQYPWTINNSELARSYAPRIKVNFFQQTKGQIQEAGVRWWELSKQGITDPEALIKAAENVGKSQNTPDGQINQTYAGGIDSITYKNMYLADHLGTMHFPFFSKEFASLQHQFEGNNSIENMFKELPAGIGEMMLNTLEKVKLGANAVTTGLKIERPSAYGNTTPTSTSFSFILYNTHGSYLTQNKRLVDTLIYLNSPQKYGPGIVLPPVLVSYEIPGIKYSPVAQMSLNVTSLGQVTYMGGIQIPDAYQIDITFSDLLIRTRNFHSPNGPRNTVSVFSEFKPKVVKEKPNTELQDELNSLRETAAVAPESLAVRDRIEELEILLHEPGDEFSSYGPYFFGLETPKNAAPTYDPGAVPSLNIPTGGF